MNRIHYSDSYQEDTGHDLKMPTECRIPCNRIHFLLSVQCVSRILMYVRRIYKFYLPFPYIPSWASYIWRCHGFLQALGNLLSCVGYGQARFACTSMEVIIKKKKNFLPINLMYKSCLSQWFFLSCGFGKFYISSWSKNKVHSWWWYWPVNKKEMR